MLNAIVPSFVEIASWQVALLLGFSFLGSALTAALSIGGGTLMIAVLSLVLPAPIIVPLHGMIQLGSNGGRVVLLRRHVSWPVFVPISIGIIIGAVGASFLVMDMPANLLRIAIALFIIYSAWGPKFKNPGTGKVSYVIGGAITSFLSMFIGASGPFLVAIFGLGPARPDRPDCDCRGMHGAETWDQNCPIRMARLCLYRLVAIRVGIDRGWFRRHIFGH